MDKKISERKLNKLFELNKKIVLEDDCASRVIIISECIKDILKVDRCTIFAYDEENNSLWSVYIDGLSYLELPNEKGIVAQVFQTKKSMIVDDVSRSEFFNPQVDKASGYVTRSILAVPILGYNNRVLGVMQLINKIDGSNKFNDEDESVLAYVISHISAYLELIMQGK
ncbi:MAG: GAF domain-containing protein [Sulfurospirillum sp.]|nr:GAF domain-containing protein [Sulfurospirillum sp.]